MIFSTDTKPAFIKKIKVTIFPVTKAASNPFMEVSISIYKFVFGTPKQNIEKEPPLHLPSEIMLCKTRHG